MRLLFSSHRKSKKVDFNPEDEVAPAEATEERPAADEEAKAEDDVEDAFANLKKKSAPIVSAQR